MLPLLLLPLLWAGALAHGPGFQLQVQESVTVQAGQCVSVPCTVSYPRIGWTDSTPAHGYWFREGAGTNKQKLVATNHPSGKVKAETRDRFHLIGNPQTYDCSLHIRDAQRRDTGRYFFRVERGTCVKENYKENLLFVKVTSKMVQALAPKPDIHLQETLESGHPKNITCTVSWDCKKDPPPQLSWTGVNRTPLGPQTQNSSVLTLTPQPQDHGTNLTCRVALKDDLISERTILLNVSYAPQLLGPSCSREDQGLRCSCSSRAQPAPSLHWRLGETLLEGNHSNASHAVTTHPAGPWANSSLSLRGELSSNLRLSCEAQNALGRQAVTVLLLPGQGRPADRTGVILGALGGAGATALLAVCLVLILWRIYSKKRGGSPQSAESQDGVSQSHLDAPSAPDLPPAVAASDSERELQYAALSFPNTKPQDPQAQETTLYSEIKIRK